MADAPPNISEVAPDFTLPGSESKPWTLSEQCAARPQVLIFYRGHW